MPTERQPVRQPKETPGLCAGGGGGVRDLVRPFFLGLTYVISTVLVSKMDFWMRSKLGLSLIGLLPGSWAPSPIRPNLSSISGWTLPEMAI